MASLIYDSAVDDNARGNIDWDNDTFYVMLVTSAYTPNKGTNLKRSDVTNEITGTGYVAGGAVSAATVVKDTANHRVDVSFAAVTWATATLVARAAVIYKHRGGVSTADELVAYADFGADISSTGAAFVVTFTTPLRYQN